MGFLSSSFGNPAFRLCGPIGFASPGYPGFAIIGKLFIYGVIETGYVN
jgi:hypothetical protein